MGRKDELPKLVNVIRRMAESAEWAGSGMPPAAAAYCAGIYNRVFERLGKDDEDVVAVFEALPLDSPSAVVVTACRLLAAYYEAAPEAEPRSASEFSFEESNAFEAPNAFEASNAFEAPNAFEESVPFRDF
jgi:hypothetical protein